VRPDGVGKVVSSSANQRTQSASPGLSTTTTVEKS